MKTLPCLALVAYALGCASLLAAVPASPPARESAELAAQYEAVSRPQFIQGKKLVSLLSIETGDSVLDLGCGTGKLAEYVAKLVGPKGRVIGLDPSPERIAIAKKREAGRLSFQVAGSDDLSSFPSGSFDRIYLNYVFHWIDKKADTLWQIARILKPGGRVGLSTGAKDQPSRIQKLIRESVREALGELPPGLFLSPFRISAQELRTLAEQVGLRIIDLQILPFSDYAKDPDDVVAFLDASSSGKFLTGVGEEERRRIIALFKRKLAHLQTPRGIEMEHPAIFLIAEKPKERSAGTTDGRSNDQPSSARHSSSHPRSCRTVCGVSSPM